MRVSHLFSSLSFNLKMARTSRCATFKVVYDWLVQAADALLFADADASITRSANAVVLNDLIDSYEELS